MWDRDDDAPLAGQMRARVRPGDLLVGLEAAGLAAGLREEGDGDVEELGGYGAIEGGHEAREGLFDGLAHLAWKGRAMSCVEVARERKLESRASVIASRYHVFRCMLPNAAGP